jgi:hypothetical protein
MSQEPVADYLQLREGGCCLDASSHLLWVHAHVRTAWLLLRLVVVTGLCAAVQLQRVLCAVCSNCLLLPSMGCPSTVAHLQGKNSTAA